MALDPISTSSFVVIVGGITAYVIKELKKNKNEKSNNGDIKAIKKTTEENLKYLNKMDKDLGIVSTNVRNIKDNCKITTRRFEKNINENREDIKDLLKGKVDK